MKTPLEHFREWKKFTTMDNRCLEVRCKNCKFEKECEAYEMAEEIDFY